MAAQVAFTLEQLAQMPDDGRLHEIDQGVLIEMTRPNSRHGELQANMIGLLREYVRRHRLGKVYTESGCVLARNPDTLRGPDAAFVRNERLKDVPKDGWAPFGPDLVVEIVSPSDTARQIDRKVHQYLDAGTRAVWIVYPDTQSVWICEPGGQGRRIEGDAVLSSPNALPGFEISVKEIFE
jgi:Uma2 family endonuclease